MSVANAPAHETRGAQTCSTLRANVAARLLQTRLACDQLALRACAHAARMWRARECTRVRVCAYLRERVCTGVYVRARARAPAR
jgi:hypothetical protein